MNDKEREIKFRVWDKINKRMLYMYDEYNRVQIDELCFCQRGCSLVSIRLAKGYEYRKLIRKGELCRNKVEFENGKQYEMETYLGTDDVILMQFTGLKDKNNKEIYEGDIVNHYGFKSEFVVCFGTYKRKDFSNNDRQVKHHGFYCKPISNYDERTQIEWNGDIESLVNFRNGVEIIGNKFQNPKLLCNGN